MTAVNWMIEKLIERHSGEVGKEYIKIFEEAKQMEKQQIIDANYDGQRLHSKSCTKQMLQDNAESYFDETYGNKGSDVPELRYKDGTPIRSYDSPKIQAMVELMNEPDTSSQTEISEHRFTEKDIRFAYMQGYNRGVDGNPNHMESYIEHLKSTKTSQTEISDEEIREQGIKYDNQALSETPIAHFMEGAFWYREQLKKK